MRGKCLGCAFERTGKAHVKQEIEWQRQRPPTPHEQAVQDPYQDLTEFALAEEPQVEQDLYQKLLEAGLAENQNEFEQADAATPLLPQTFSSSEEDNLPDTIQDHS